MTLERALNPPAVATVPATASLWRAIAGRFGIHIGVILGGLLVWELASLFTSPIFLPGPASVAASLGSLIASGEIFVDIAMSYFRILSGWLIGAVIAIPLGLMAGRLEIARLVSAPFINFFRFIPPIAFIGIAIIWFGLGEASKVILIVYTSLFTVFLNITAGAQGVVRERIWAAQSLGASRGHIFRTVVLPSTVPSMVTGLRVAMGTSFMTVIAAEIVAADSGVGHLIWDARLFAQTDRAFAGIFVLGLMGFAADLVFRLVVRRLAHRYEIHF